MLEHLERLIDARTVEEIWALHCERMAELGFDRLLYGFTRFSTAHSFGNIEDTLILSNHDPAYLEAFMDEGVFNNAPMVRWAAENKGACSWRWVEQQARAGGLTAAERKVQELNLKFGIRAGYSISFPEQAGRAKGAIGLCARKDLYQHDVEELWAQYGREIFVVNTLTHLRISSMPFATARRPLTARQREVLEWVGDGKTTADIATIMGLTPATVEKHLRLARDSLDVGTTAQAVLKASFQNQIFLSSGNDAPATLRR